MFNYIMSRNKRHCVYYILLILCCLFYNSCSKDTCSANDKDYADLFEIHLQQNYYNSYTNIRIDGERVFSGEITTEGSISLAAVISLEIENGCHTIQANIETAEADTIFTIHDSLIIAIRYDESMNNITYHFYDSSNFPLYD